MNKVELQAALSDDFESSSYSLEATFVPPDEALCLRQEDSTWVVYYSERGLQTGRRAFAEESEACEFFLKAMVSDPTTRKGWKSRLTLS
jgi:hypothetical protein